MRNTILGNNLKGGKLIIKGYHNALVRENTDKLWGGKCQEAFFQQLKPHNHKKQKTPDLVGINTF